MKPVDKSLSYDKRNNKGKERKPLAVDVCRLCMSKDAKIQIFPEKTDAPNYKDLPLVCKIMSCVNIQVRKDDGLSTHICCDCASKVEETYDFLRLCETSDSFLRQYLDFGLHISFLIQYSAYLRMDNFEEEEEEIQNSDLVP